MNYKTSRIDEVMKSEKVYGLGLGFAMAVIAVCFFVILGRLETTSDVGHSSTESIAYVMAGFIVAFAFIIGWLVGIVIGWLIELFLSAFKIIKGKQLLKAIIFLFVVIAD